MYNEEAILDRARKAHTEYEKNPDAWLKASASRSRAIAISAWAVAVCVIAIVLAINYPSFGDIDVWIRSERSRPWLVALTGGLGLLLCILKLRYRLLFGATEIAFSIASAFAVKPPSLSNGLSAWLAVVAITYIFVNGFENSYHGFFSFVASGSSPPPEPSQHASNP